MAKEINQPLERQEKFNPTINSAPAGQAAQQFGMHETLLGQLGSQIAQQSANVLSARLGEAEGDEPHGDLLPPITQADKFYKDAYTSQAHNTMALRLNSMFTQSQNEVEAANNITPEMISEYRTQTSEASKEILANAPSDVRNELGAQISNNIINSSGAMTKKMIADNKKRAQQEMILVDKNYDTNILNNAMLGEEDSALELYHQKLEHNQRQFDSNMMDAAQKDASDTSAKLSYWSGIYNSRALQARKEKGNALGEFLDSMTDISNKPEDLSVAEWNTIGNNTLSFMHSRDAMQSTSVGLVKSQLNVKIANLTITDQDLLNALKVEGFSQQDFNEYTAKLYTVRNAQSKDNAATQNAIASFTNTDDFAKQSPASIDKAYTTLSEEAYKQDPSLQPFEAETRIAASAAGPVNRFLNTLSLKARSGNVDEMMQAANAYETVFAAKRNNVAGFDPQSYNLINTFQSLRKSYDPQTALNLTHEALLNRKPEEQKAVDQLINEQIKDKFSNSFDQMNFAKKALGVNGIFSGFDIDDPIGTSAKARERYLTNFNITKDETMAMDMTKRDLARIYGKTKVNGAEKITLVPLEKAVNRGDDSSYFIQQDMVKQFLRDVEPYQTAAKAGNSLYHYEIKNPEIYNKDVLHTNLTSRNRINQRINQIDKEIKESFPSALPSSEFTETERKSWESRIKSAKTPGEALRIQNEMKRAEVKRAGGILQHAKNRLEYLATPNVHENEGRRQELLREKADLINETKSTNSKIESISDWQEPVYVNKVFKGGHVETYRLEVKPGANTTESNDINNPVSGVYNYILYSNNGASENIPGIQGYNPTPIYYEPNFGAIRDNYDNYATLIGVQQSAKANAQQYLRQEREQLNDE